MLLEVVDQSFGACHALVELIIIHRSFWTSLSPTFFRSRIIECSLGAHLTGLAFWVEDAVVRTQKLAFMGLIIIILVLMARLAFL